MIVTEAAHLIPSLKLLISHGWGEAAKELAATALAAGQIDVAHFGRVCESAAVLPKDINGDHEAYGVVWDSVVSSLQFRELTSIEEMTRSFTQAVRWIEIETSSQCNRACAYCPNSKHDRRDGNAFMPEVEFDKILRELHEIDYDGKLVLVGTNELFLHERNLEYVAKVKRLVPKTRLVLFSNGDYIKRDHLDAIERAGVNNLNVTFHLSTDAPYSDTEVLARAHGFAKKLKIALILDDFAPGRHLYFTAQHGRTKITAGLQDFRKVGHSWAGAVDVAGSCRRRTTPCSYPLRQLVLNYHCDLMPCCVVPRDRTADNIRNGAIAGNLADFPSIFHAYASSGMLQWRKATLKGKAMPHPCIDCAGHNDVQEERFERLANHVAAMSAP